MATGISGSMSTYTSTYIVAAVDYSETYDVASNASAVTAILYYKRTNTYNYDTTSPGTFYVKINGESYAVYTGTFRIPANDNNWHEVGRKTVTGIVHNSDGSKTISIGGSHSTTATNVAYLNFSMSKDIALTTIPRASKPTVSTGTLVMGNSLQIATNRASSSFTHTITVSCGGHSVTYNNVGTSVQFVAGSSEWMPYMTSWEQTATVSCTTYNGSTKIGSTQTCTFKLRVDTSVYKPVIGATTTADPNPTTQAMETAGTFILNASKLTVTADFSVNNTDYGSALASATVTCGGQSHLFTLSGASGSIEYTFPNAIDSSNVTIAVVDNRGVSVTKIITLTAMPYQPISIKSVKGVRTNASGDEAETGDRITYTITLNVYWGSFGQVNNQIVLKMKYKSSAMADYSEWSTQTTITLTGEGQYMTYTLHGTTDATVSFSSAEQYDVIFHVEDLLSEANTTDVRILPGVPVFGWGEDYFDVYGEFHVHDRTDVMKYITIGADSVESVPVTFSGAAGGTVNWTIFKFGRLRVATCRWRAASNYTCNSAWGSLYYSANVNTPNFPVVFDRVTYQNIRYVGADSGATYTAFAELNILPADSSGNTNNTNMGSLSLYRPDSGATIGHPVFTQIVIGTVS